MGAWGTGTFDNDTAADWAGDLVDGGTVDFVRGTLATTAGCGPEDYLEAPEGTEALAAAEVVAAAAGRPPDADAYCEDALEWAAAHPRAAVPEMVELARTAVERVLGANSELRELWEEADSLDEWEQAVADLQRRLR